MHHSTARRAVACLLLASLLNVQARAEDRPLAEKARAILASHCGACHGPGGSGKGGFAFVLDRDRLVSRDFIRPGKPAESPLWQRVEQKEMPPASSKKPRPTAEELAVLRQWIESQAPAWEIAKPPSTVTTAALFKMVRDDLLALEPGERRFARYLSLTHLTALSAEDLQRHRHAVVKLVNSLSWHPRLTRPVAVDPAQLVYRVDLREYKWSARAWDRLAATNPYRLGELTDISKSLSGLAGCEQPLLRGDWFTATASRPPFYFDFLDMPSTDAALERTLQVDVRADQRDGTALRAGFNGSGVARNNRVLERHDAMTGAYWKSYDFADNLNRQNVFEHPLGPGGPVSFVQAGGEIIFNLPNGLHGFMLIDGLGRRVDKAPGDIVSDPKRPDRLVETGVSCFSCHFKGYLPKEDQVRAHVQKNAMAFTDSDRRAILALYVPPTRFKARMDEDNERFARSMARIGVPLVEPEPIEVVTLRYEGVVDLATAAVETGLTAEEFSARLRRTPALSRSLGALLARGGTVQRQAFQETFFDVARAFGLDKDVGTVEALPATVADAFRGHQGSVRGLAFSPDARFVITGGDDRSVRLWDAATGKELRRFDGHAEGVNAVAASRDARRIVSAGSDRVVRVWDGETGKLVHKLVGHTDVVRAVAVSPDGKVALSGGTDRIVFAWDVEKGTAFRSWSVHTRPVTSVALSPDGRLALSGSLDGAVKSWNFRDGGRGDLDQAHGGEVYAVAFSADGKTIASAGNDRTVRLWDASGRALRRLSGHENAVIRVAFTPDGKSVLSGSSRYQTADRVIRVWDAKSGQELADRGAETTDGVEATAFSPDGKSALLSQPGVGLRLVWIGK
jgi:mono/diheme cytochrome c family protein